MIDEVDRIEYVRLRTLQEPLLARFNELGKRVRKSNAPEDIAEMRRVSAEYTPIEEKIRALLDKNPMLFKNIIRQYGPGGPASR
jgi:hypothetical protein